MERLWTPWRMEYILGGAKGECIFCTRPRDPSKYRENLIIHAGERAFIIMNRFPYNNGHLMVVPFRHTGDLTTLTAEENGELARLLQASVAILEKDYRAEGFNIGLNLGRAGGAGYDEHIHYHIVPRWVGDTNFMPVLGQTKTIPEHLLESYDRLEPRFRELLGRGGRGAG